MDSKTIKLNCFCFFSLYDSRSFNDKTQQNEPIFKKKWSGPFICFLLLLLSLLLLFARYLKKTNNILCNSFNYLFMVRLGKAIGPIFDQVWKEEALTMSNRRGEGTLTPGQALSTGAQQRDMSSTHLLLVKGCLLNTIEFDLISVFV